MDFTAYNTFLRGSSPNAVVRTPFARHRQTFKAREYVLFEPTTLRVGVALDAFLPEKPAIKNTLSGVEIEGTEYLAAADLSEEQKEGNVVQDVVILGEVIIHRALASTLMPCLRSGSIGSFIVGTIPYPRPCEAMRWFGMLPQRLRAFPHASVAGVASDVSFLPW